MDKIYPHCGKAGCARVMSMEERDKEINRILSTQDQEVRSYVRRINLALDRMILFGRPLLVDLVEQLEPVAQPIIVEGKGG